MSGCRNLLLSLLLIVGVVAMLGGTGAADGDDKEAKKLRHVVMFKFNEDASEDDIKKVEQAFAALPGKIDAIADFEWGTNNSPEGHDKGFTHCFLVTFRSEKAREVYLPHEAHQEFVNVLKPHLDDVMVIDYWAAKK